MKLAVDYKRLAIEAQNEAAIHYANAMDYRDRGFVGAAIRAQDIADAWACTARLHLSSLLD